MRPEIADHGPATWVEYPGLRSEVQYFCDGCGPEPKQHEHLTPDTERVLTVTTVHGKESECPECTEEVSE